MSLETPVPSSLKFRVPNPKEIFADRDGDGLADTVDLQLHLLPSCSHPSVLSAVIELSACLGFETLGLDLPIAEARGIKKSSYGHHLFIGTTEEFRTIEAVRGENDYLLAGNKEVSLAKRIRDFTSTLSLMGAKPRRRWPFEEDKKRRGFNLLNPFSGEGFFQNSSQIPLPLSFPYKIVLFSRLPSDTAAAASNFGARLGLESLSFSLPFCFPLGMQPKDGGPFIYLGGREELERIQDRLSKELPPGGWDSGIFLLPSGHRLPNVLITGEAKSLEGILRLLSQLPADSKGTNFPLFEKIRELIMDLEGRISGRISPQKVKPGRKVLREYSISDERREIEKLLVRGLEKVGNRGGQVEVNLLITRPEKIRRRFERSVRHWLSQAGVDRRECKVFVLNAYKPGLSWLREIVLREIRERPIDRIEIAFKEFKVRGLEEPVRWLEEIYPIDEILASILSISRDKIQFRIDPKMDEIYRFRAWKGRRLVYESHFSPRWQARPYLKPFPKLGQVHPCTGWFEMQAKGGKVIAQSVKTGMERIWEIYQSKILPLIAREAEKILSKRPLRRTQSLFEELRFDIYFDYPMEAIDVDEERISPLEALHEDLYFVTLDFITRLLKQKGLRGISPGRVLPAIHPVLRGAKERIVFTLVHTDQRRVEPDWEGQGEKVFLKGILFNRSTVGLALLVEKGRLGLPMEKAFGEAERVDQFKIRRRGRHILLYLPLSEKAIELRPVRRRPLAIPMDRSIGYKEGVRILRSLEGLPGVKVQKEVPSSGGLPIFSIELAFPCPSKFVSHAKRIIRRPTFFINCRHHANEVSSTNAALKLAHLLATQSSYQTLLKRCNVLINPMENVDGVALLEEMLKYTPTDKLHAGRYNKAGQEYYGEYFNLRTPFGEAKVKPMLWRRWLPDLCTDNHGFPSHEWDQPFSGVSPFRFREWWIPRAFFFVYLPYLEKAGHSLSVRNSRSLRDWIVKALAQEERIIKRNKTFSARYFKYRGKWLYRRSGVQGEIQCFPIEKRFRRTNFSYRYPFITTVDFTTEVADETAQGRFLRDCILAHLKCNLSIINLLNCLDFRGNKFRLERAGGLHFVWWRERPLRLNEVRKEVRASFERVSLPHREGFPIENPNQNSR